MPVKGFKTITVRDSIYNSIKEFANRYGKNIQDTIKIMINEAPQACILNQAGRRPLTPSIDDTSLKSIAQAQLR
jgi:hypothetical protein